MELAVIKKKKKTWNIWYSGPLKKGLTLTMPAFTKTKTWIDTVKAEPSLPWIMSWYEIP